MTTPFQKIFFRIFLGLKFKVVFFLQTIMYLYLIFKYYEDNEYKSRRLSSI
jgi:hypothetical protein